MKHMKGLVPTIVGGVMGNSVIYLIPLLVGAMVTDRGFSEEQAGYMASADLAGYTVTTLLTALLLHRMSWRSAALAALALMIGANIGTTFLYTASSFAAIRFASGAGGGILAAIATVSLGQTDRPDRNYGVLFAASLLFGAAGLWGLPLLLGRFGLNGGYWVVALLALVTVPFAVRLPKDRQGREQATTTSCARTPWLLAAIVLAAILVFWTEQNTVYAYMERMGAAAGLTPEYIGFGLGIVNLAGFAGAALVAWLGTRFGRAVPLVLVTAVKLGCFAALGIKVGAISYLLAFATLAVAWNVMNPFQFGILAAVDPSGRALAMASTVTGAGLAIGPAAGAMVIGHGGGYGTILWLASALAIVSLILSLAPIGLAERHARLLHSVPG